MALLLTNNAVFVDAIATPYGVLLANPQMYNYGNPVLGDTLNCTKASAVYKAQGVEQFITLGNFKTNAQTILQQIQPTGYYVAGHIIDDVSVIPIDSICLKACAGKDTTITAGDSIFVGSYTNGIDSLIWLQNGTIPTDSTRPGFYIKPTSSTFYVLHQVVNGCFSSDTIYINVNPLPLKFISYNVSIPRLGGVRGASFRNILTTTNEINVSHFSVQRSTNAKDFTTIGNVKAQNKNSNEYTLYDSSTLEGYGWFITEQKVVIKTAKNNTNNSTNQHQTPNKLQSTLNNYYKALIWFK